MLFTCRSFIAAPTDQSWSQFWENEPDNLVLSSKHGHIFGLINLQSQQPDTNLSAIGRDIIASISSVYFQTSLSSPAASLRQTITQIDQKYSSSYQLTLILVAIIKSDIYLGQLGSGTVLLHRGSHISRLFTSTTTINIIKGNSLPQDQYFLSTNSFIDKIGLNQIKSVLPQSNLQSLEETLLSSLYSLDDQTNLAAALIITHSDQVEESSSETSPPPLIESKPITPHPPLFTKLLKQLFKPKPLYASPEPNRETLRRRRINVVAALIFLTLLGITSYFGYRRNQRQKIESQYQQLKTEVTKLIQNAEAVKNLSFDSAKELATQANDTVKKMALLHLNPVEVSQYQGQISQLLSQTGSSDSWQPTRFYDLSLIVNQPNYTDFILNQNQLYLLDRRIGRIDSLDIKDKSTKIVSQNDQLKTLISFSAIDSNLYGVDDQGFVQISKNSLTQLIPYSVATKPTLLLSWNHVFYLLDGATPTIWKYSFTNNTLTAGENWLANNGKFKTAPSSFAINGKLWVLSSDGQITPYLRGVADTFKLSSSITTTQAGHLVTGVDNQILAFTDADNLVYIINKDGQVKSKYNFGDKKILNLVMNEADSLIYVLCSDQKIYTITF